MTYSLNDYIDAAAVLMAGRDKEIERLKAQVAELTAEVNHLRAEIERLESALDECRGDMAV